MPGTRSLPTRPRLTQWDEFALGGHEAKQRTSMQWVRPPEPVTRLDLDVRAGNRPSKFSMKDFNNRVYRIRGNGL